MWWELNNTERPAKGKWLRGTSLIEATAGFTSFERNEMYDRRTGILNRNHSHFKKVVKYAMQTENTYNNRRPPDATPSAGTNTNVTGDVA